MFFPILENLADFVAKIRSGFGNRTHPITGEYSFHNGVDIGAPEGTIIFSPLDGIVKDIWTDELNGNGLRIDHSGNKDNPDVIETGYAHLSGYFEPIAEGFTVKKGQPVAYVGTTGRSTGPHLHFVVRVADRKEVDPKPYLEGSKKKLIGLGIGFGSLLLIGLTIWWLRKK